MPITRGRSGLVGLSADSPIDLVSDDDDVQLPVASRRTRVQTTVQQPVRYSTRSVMRAQKAAETPGIQTRSTALWAGTSVDPGSQAHARAERGNTTATTVGEPLPDPNLNMKHDTRSNKQNGNPAASVTSLQQSSAKPASISKMLGAGISNRLIRTQKRTQSRADHTPADALEVDSLKTLSSGLLPTHKGANSEIHAQASGHRDDLLANELAIVGDHSVSSSAAKIPGLPYRNAPSRARPYGEEPVRPHEFQGLPFNVTNDKVSGMRSLQTTDKALTRHNGTDVFLPDLTGRGGFDGNDSTLLRATPQQTIMGGAVMTKHVETAVSLSIQAPRIPLGAARTQRTVERIPPADRAETRGKAIAGMVRHSRANLHEKRRERRERRALRQERTQTKRHKKTLDLDIVMIGGSHKNFSFWKQKAAEKFLIGPELRLISAAVAMFDKQQIQTVVPNRYLRTGARSKNAHRQHLTFPGTVEMLLDTPMTAVENAYKEHTADKLDTSRIVLWTDGSAAGSRRHSNKPRGFAVTWRRSTATGWGRWEALGFQAKGELMDSGSMEILAVMKAITKACDLAREMSGQLKRVAIYTDSVDACRTAQKPSHPLGLHIIKKARMLKNFGPTLSLHWCPGHSNVPGNELADKIAGMARSHVYGSDAEFMDLSDDDDDGWVDM